METWAIIFHHYMFGAVMLLLFILAINKVAQNQVINRNFGTMLFFIALWPIAIPIILLMPKSVIERLANDNRR